MATAEGKVSQEGASKAGRGSIITDKKYSSTVPKREQSRSSSSDKGEPSGHQAPAAVRRVQGESQQARHSIVQQKDKVSCLKTAPQAQQRGPR